jgi:hypothetical protein
MAEIKQLTPEEMKLFLTIPERLDKLEREVEDIRGVTKEIEYLNKEGGQGCCEGTSG